MHLQLISEHISVWTKLPINQHCHLSHHQMQLKMVNLKSIMYLYMNHLYIMICLYIQLMIQVDDDSTQFLWISITQVM